MIRRNCRHLNPLGSTTTSEPEEISSQPEEIDEETNGQLELNSQPSTEQKHSRSGRVSVRTTRLIEDTDWR